MCSTTWKTRDEFLEDRTLVINGYGVDFERLEWSLFYFTHAKDGCDTTLAIPAEEFFDLYEGERFNERKTGQKDCPRYCLDEKQLNRCDAFCECVFNREIIRMIKERHGR